MDVQAIVLGSLLIISEILGLSTAVKPNGIIDAILQIIQTIITALQKTPDVQKTSPTTETVK